MTNGQLLTAGHASLCKYNAARHTCQALRAVSGKRVKARRLSMTQHRVETSICVAF
jgi:hypothetical protein